MARCAFLSFRLGLADGVSVVASSWDRALTARGFDTVTIAGEGPVDRIVGGLAIDAAEPPTRSELELVLEDIDLVVVENLLSIPLNLPTSRVVAETLAGRPALLHHHDPPWQRERFAHIDELPPHDPAWRHVVINKLTQREMADRGLESTVIYNGFNVSPPVADRAATRSSLGVGPDEPLLAHPVRAIERKNIPQALHIAAELGGTYWLLGQAEDGYDDELETHLAQANCRVIHQPAASRAEIYAAADLVLFPSTWEGFGNPPIEAAIYRKPVVVGTYPVAQEFRDLGFQWLTTDDIEKARGFLAKPEDPSHVETLEVNRSLAESHLSFEIMAERLGTLIDEAGWTP